MKIRRRTLAALLASGAVLFQLSGCGGGGDSSSAPASTTLSGTAMAGPFLSGQACAYKLADGVRGERLGPCVDLASSAFSIDIGSYTGDVLVEIPSGARYDDEADPSDDATGTLLTGTLRSLVSVASAGGSTGVVVTPYTEAALRLAGTKLDAAGVQAALDRLAAVLPEVQGLDLRTTAPLSTSDLGLAYRELLRALSQLQWAAGNDAAYPGGLDSYLASLLPQLGSNADGVATALLTQLSSGLSANCSLASGSLQCTVANDAGSGGDTGGGSSAPLSCNTAYFQPGTVLAAPTSTQLASYARTYTGSEGNFDASFNFVATGSATLVFKADGSATYNSGAYMPTSYCVETLSDGAQQLVLHGPNESHFDLRGPGDWSGYSPAGLSVSNTPYAAGGNAGFALSLPNGKQITDAATLSYLPIVNVTGGKILTFTQGTAKVEVYDYIDTLGVNVADTGMSIGIAPSNGCALNPSWINPSAPACADVGINFDRSSGLISFTATPMHAVIFSCPGDCTVSGTLRFSGY